MLINTLTWNSCYCTNVFPTDFPPPPILLLIMFLLLNFASYDVEELVGKKINILIPSPYKEQVRIISPCIFFKLIHSQHDTYLKRYLTTGIPR
jgi:hypothetical protein